ncbi:radical SAM protein [bacterium]|nr:radical SAM protein [candidate division CSSED10-310 bacterium]
MSLIKDTLHGLMSKYIPVYPFGAIFMVTSRCNAHCKMCDIWQRKSTDLDINIYENFLKSPVLSKIVNAAFTGGEPTLRTDLDRMVEILLNHCPDLESMNISTNALNPDHIDENIAKILHVRNTLKPDLKLLIQISLDGPGNLHDSVRGIKGAFNRVMTTVSRLEKRFTNEKNAELYFLCVLQPENLVDIDSLEQFFDEQPHDTVFNMICDASYVVTNNLYSPQLTLEHEKILTSFYKRLLQNPHLSPRLKYHYREILSWLELGFRSRTCGLITQHIILSVDGQLLPCLNCGNHMFPEISYPKELHRFWKSRERQKTVRNIKENLCAHCRASCGPNIFDAAFALVKESFIKRFHRLNGK